MAIKDLISSSPKWQHPDLEVRLRAIGEVTETDILKQLIAEDPEERARCAAISQLDDYALLESLAGEKGATGDTARQQYCHLLSSDSSLAHSKSIVLALTNKLLIKEIALSSNDFALIGLALDKIVDEDLLTEIASHARTTRVRQAAAEKITSTSHLEILQKAAKQKDKLVFNIARTKLRALQQAQAEQQKLTLDMSDVASEMEQLASSQQHPSFERTFNYLTEKWHTLEQQSLALHDDADQQILITIRDAFEQSKKLCSDQIESVLREKRKDQEALIEAEQIVERLDAMLTDLHQSCDELEKLSQPVNDMRERWHHLSQHKLTPKLSEAYYRDLNKIEFLLDASTRWGHIKDQLPNMEKMDSVSRQLHTDINHLHWPEDFPAPNDLSRIRELLAQHETQNSISSREKKEAREKIQQRLIELDGAIKAGHVKQASRVRKELRRALGHSSRSGSQFEKLQQLSSELEELKDWQGYATGSKREALCEKMNNLIQLQLDPREKADRISELHQQWKALGDSHTDQKRWHRFKQASDKAYEPCREYFQNLALQRKQRFQERTQICEQLEYFETNNNWESAQWKAVAEIIMTARRQWRQLGPIDHSHRKSVQPRFYKILDALQARLVAEQDHNRDIKLDLIKQVEQLTIEEEDLSRAITRTIAIQKQWKSVGVTDRKVDQKLWKKFRRACDAVFNRKDEQRKSELAEEEKSLQAAEDLCRKIAELAGNSAPEEPLSRSQLRQFKSAFNQIDIARRFQKKIESQFKQVCKDFTHAIETQNRRQRNTVIDELARLAHVCEQLESHTGSEEAFKQLQSELEQQLSTSVPLPAEIRERIDQRWSAIKISATSEHGSPEKSGQDYSEAAHLLCVKLELLAGIESPPEDQELRMSYQVSRLKKEFSERQKETRSPEEQLRSLQIDWYCLGPIPANEAEALKQRFLAATASMQ